MQNVRISFTAQEGVTVEQARGNEGPKRTVIMITELDNSVNTYLLMIRSWGRPTCEALKPLHFLTRSF